MSELHVRTFPTEIKLQDEGFLTGRLVPFDVSVPVADVVASGLDEYVEGFRAGAFHRQLDATEPGVLRRVGLKHEHNGGGGASLGYIGPLTEAWEEPDGLYGKFMVLPSRRNDVSALVGLGIEHLSIEFLEMRKGTDVADDGVRWRTDVHLSGVALLPQGAYGEAGAKVLALRELSERSELDRIERESEAAETLERERAEAAAAAAEAERAARFADWDTFLEAEKARQTELSQRYA